jgi:hypothetical protein
METETLQMGTLKVLLVSREACGCGAPTRFIPSPTRAAWNKIPSGRKPSGWIFPLWKRD